ncbi:hypothetical protein WNY63_20465 [Pseudoalteromonas neustonica]|uniref:Uncharacterized protein n=1 Tax=Pseudoalteromonas neustonica TaxID=1840331 RepID=A0ABU9U7T6_9GAMM
MGIKDEDYQQTKKELRLAIIRLQKGEPENPKLIQRIKDGKTVKVNNLNVEIEAGKSNGLINKSHTDLEEEIYNSQPNLSEYKGEVTEHPLYSKRIANDT